MTRPNTFISVDDVRATPPDLEFAGNVSFNMSGSDHLDCAFLFTDSYGRRSIAWRLRDSEKVLDTHFAQRLDQVAYCEIETQILEQLRPRKGASGA